MDKHGVTLTRQGEAGALDVEFERRDGVLIVSASGRLESANAAEFYKTVRAEIDDADRAVIMDFEALTFLGSAGLRAVFMTASDLDKRDGGIAVCSPAETDRQGDPAQRHGTADPGLSVEIRRSRRALTGSGVARVAVPTGLQAGAPPPFIEARSSLVAASSTARLSSSMRPVMATP